MKKKIVFSAINVTSGGPLTILQKFMEFASSHLSNQFEIWFLIKDRSVLSRTYPGIHLSEFPDSQKTFLHKLYYEYYHFRKVSRLKKPFLWFSLNDCSPSVEAAIKVVYIHNATPFYKFSLLDFRFPSRILLQRFYYNFFLKTNLKKNSFVVVQQQFMKDYVVERLGFAKAENVVVTPPVFSIHADAGIMAMRPEEETTTSVFLLYPTKAEVYKNVHRLVDAAITLVRQESFPDFTLWLTLTGNENAYSRYLARRTEDYPQVVFKGPLSFQVLMGHLQAADLMVFPSKLETWGLPLSEAAYFNKWIIAADLPYARETLKGYPRALFFNPDSTSELVDCIKEGIDRVKGQVVETELKSTEAQMSEEQSLRNLFEKILSQNI